MNKHETCRKDNLTFNTNNHFENKLEKAIHHNKQDQQYASTTLDSKYTGHVHTTKATMPHWAVN